MLFISSQSKRPDESKGLEERRPLLTGVKSSSSSLLARIWAAIVSLFRFNFVKAISHKEIEWRPLSLQGDKITFLVETAASRALDEKTEEDIESKEYWVQLNKNILELQKIRKELLTKRKAIGAFFFSIEKQDQLPDGTKFQHLADCGEYQKLKIYLEQEESKIGRFDYKKFNEQVEEVERKYEEERIDLIDRGIEEDEAFIQIAERQEKEHPDIYSVKGQKKRDISLCKEKFQELLEEQPKFWALEKELTQYEKMLKKQKNILQDQVELFGRHFDSGKKEESEQIEQTLKRVEEELKICKKSIFY